ncbi:hypothetical protein [Bacillus solimangrovi]|uniref:Abortive phage infection protein n=1 Tax=Bacillus solimangrovi TaxID=1305675 RepID=A0A1E5LEG9_9BACI|nr:hypothetical protein [Bacillus solimangrovi]OEH92474.1 hypothetical protein BFG57_15555 [Bacillus solimangrovi]
MADELQKIVEQLASGEMLTYEVEKQQTTSFFEIIRVREDFKHFRGQAKKGGNVVYQYLNEPRS